MLRLRVRRHAGPFPAIGQRRFQKLFRSILQHLPQPRPAPILQNGQVKAAAFGGIGQQVRRRLLPGQALLLTGGQVGPLPGQ